MKVSHGTLMEFIPRELLRGDRLSLPAFNNVIKHLQEMRKADPKHWAIYITQEDKDYYICSTIPAPLRIGARIKLRKSITKLFETLCSPEEKATFETGIVLNIGIRNVVNNIRQAQANKKNIVSRFHQCFSSNDCPHSRNNYGACPGQMTLLTGKTFCPAPVQSMTDIYIPDGPSYSLGLDCFLVEPYNKHTICERPTNIGTRHTKWIRKIPKYDC